jgi:hypothetical protein
MSDLAIGDEVKIWADPADGGDMMGKVVEVDVPKRRALIEYTSGSEDGDRQWWAMDAFRREEEAQ